MNKMLITAMTISLLAGSCMTAMAEKSVTLEFDSNRTTGYDWFGHIIGGDSVELGDGVYLEDENPEMLDGIGGTTVFTLNAAEPGKSLVMFEYGRPGEMDTDEKVLILAEVDEDGNLTTMDVTESSMIEGIVTDVSEEDAAVTVYSEVQGEILAYFAEDLAIPVMDEEVRLYTDGVMTMSVPPIVNVLGWGSIPSDLAREDTSEDINGEAIPVTQAGGVLAELMDIIRGYMEKALN